MKTNTLICICTMMLLVLITMHHFILLDQTFDVFSPPEPVADTSRVEAPALLSTLDLQRELNRRGYKLIEDGVCGRATQAAWDTEIGNQYAAKLGL